MRRSFNKGILPKEAPPKNMREYKRKEHYKTKQKRCAELEILFQDYKKQAGKKFSLTKLSKACGVHTNTSRRWFYGFCPGHLIYWNIARYFEPYLSVSAEVIHADIKDTIDDWRAGNG